MINSVFPDKAEQKLELLGQAERLAKALREFMERNIPELPDSEDAELVFFVEQYTAAVSRLKTISNRVAVLNDDDQIDPRTEPQCEQLRVSARANLDVVAALYQECRVVVEERRDMYQRELLKARKKQNLSVYLRSPLIGQSAYQFDQAR